MDPLTPEEAQAMREAIAGIDRLVASVGVGSLPAILTIGFWGWRYVKGITDRVQKNTEMLADIATDIRSIVEGDGTSAKYRELSIKYLQRIYASVNGEKSSD